MGRSNRLAWLEGLRAFAAVMILLYHGQLFFTGYAYTPQPSGLLDNLGQMLGWSGKLAETTITSGHPWLDWVGRLASLPLWFGFQFVDVFVLVSGFSLVLSLRGEPLHTGSFLKRRLLRLLWPFWTVAWLSYPILWLLGTLTKTYKPDAWHSFAGITFPLFSDYRGSILLSTSGPWWFVPLILSLTFVFPFLWKLLQRWGTLNLLIVSTIVTLSYRTLAVYQLGGHPTYVIIDTPAAEQPFQFFLAKLSTFVIGMVVGLASTKQQGPLYWRQGPATALGILLYGLGFVCQFSRVGWILADLLLPLGLTLLCMVVGRRLEKIGRLTPLMITAGASSYSFFLIHNLVVDRTLNLVVQGNLGRYCLLLPLMVVVTQLLAMLADGIRPKLEQKVTGLLKGIDQTLTQARWN